MGVAREYFTAIGRTALTIADGLAVTFSYLLRRPVTLQYPDRMAEPVVKLLPPRSRGMLEVDIDLCTACGACDRSCPIDCIAMEVVKDAERGRLIRRLDIDLGRCMFCGLCTEACPTGAIRHSHEFEGGTGAVQNLVVSFLDEPRAPAKAKQEPPPAPKPLGSILRARMPGPWAPPRPPPPPGSPEGGSDAG